MENFMIRKRSRWCGYCNQHFDLHLEQFLEHLDNCEYVKVKFSKKPKNPTEPTEGGNTHPQ